MLRGAKCNI
jgi:hypothetical protein